MALVDIGAAEYMVEPAAGHHHRKTGRLKESMVAPTNEFSISTDPLPGIAKLIVLGKSGFVGSRIVEYFEEKYPGLPVTGLSSKDIDLSDRTKSGELAEYFEPDTAVIMCSGIKSNYGSNLETYARNVAMAQTVSQALSKRPVRRLVFFSSIAVYGVDSHDVGITEETVIRPDTHYGLAKFDSECLLRLQLGEEAKRALLVLRTSTIYGPKEKILAATPSGFLTTYVRGGEVTLFGDGSELREFLFIEDAISILDRLLTIGFAGVLNVGPGVGISYQQSLDAIARLLGRELSINRKERTKAKVDKLYNTELLRSVIPQCRFTSLEDGLSSILTDLTPSPA